MFADVADSTAATEGFDPELAAAFLNTAIGAMMDAVHRYEGTVSEVAGDGIVALFGAPIAHEDHAVRACLAAGEIEDSVVEATGGSLHTRVGLNSGEVFVQAIGTDLSFEYQALGPMVHLAARMETMAEPGSVRLTAATLGLAEEFITTRSLGPLTVRGFSEPLEVFELVGLAPRSAWEARATRGLTKLVARDQELAALTDAMARAESGEGHVVAVVGDPGMGKSRIVHEFLVGLVSEAVTILRGGASPYDVDTTYFALKDVVRSALACSGRPLESLESVDAALADLGVAAAGSAPALASVMDLPVSTVEWTDMSPESRRRSIRDAFRALSLGLARERPLVIAIEDLHWVDGESQAVIDDLVEVAGGSRILLLVTHRPEYVHEWAAKSYYTRQTLSSLNNVDADTLLEALIGSDPSVEGVRPLLRDRSEGTPLFLEECVRSLVDAGQLVGEPGRYRARTEITEIDIPDRVQAVLAARIDRLEPDEKTVLQAAAVIGDVIDRSLLEAVTPSIDISPILDELQGRELLFEQQTAAEPRYRFKHALTRDVAYESIPLAHRRELHGRLLQIMRGRGDTTDEHVERLAFHALHGELWEEAADFAEAAAEKGIERSAYAEASRFLRTAIDALARLPETAETVRRGIDLRMRQRVAETGSEGGLARISGILREASGLARSIDDKERLANIDIHLGYAANMLGDAIEAEEAGWRALEIAEMLDDRYLAAEARLLLGQTYDYAGRPRAVIEMIEPDLDYFGGELRHERLGQTMIRSVVAHSHVAIASSLVGHSGAAITRADQAVEIAEEAARPFDLLYAYFARGICFDLEGRIEESIDSHQRAADIGHDHDLWFIRSFAQPWRGHALLGARRDEEATALLDDVREAGRRVGLPYVEWLAAVFAAEGHRRLGRVGPAAALASRALDFAQHQRLPLIEIAALRTLGDLASDGADRIDRLRRAEAAAETHGYGPWLEQIRADLAV
jgi:class 3 adenylate cyclase/tetratricopeptide (TPR) repeat protein